MDGRMFSATFSGVSYTGGAARDVWELKADADQVIVIHSCFIGNYGTTQYGDAASQGMWVRMIRAFGSFTSGSGGSAITPEPHDGGAALAGTVCEGNNSTPAVVGSGTFVTLRNETWHAQAGWFYNPTPKEMYTLHPSQALIITFPDDGALNPSGDMPKVTSTITFEIFGMVT